VVGLREFSIRQFFKKNFNFIAGILSELGLVLAIMVVSIFICLVLMFIKP